MDERTQREAEGLVKEGLDLNKEKAIVLASEGWHPGVLGIVAARLAESFYRPTILVSFDREEGKGSGRSIPGFDLFAALKESSHHLESFGGHRQAAGLTVSRPNFENFKRAFLQAAEKYLNQDDLIRRQTVEAEIELQEIDLSLIESLELLAPFGPGNMRPVFMTKNLSKADFPGIVGNNHLKLRVSKQDCQQDAIGFDFGHWAKSIAVNPGTFDLAYVLENNPWNGRDRIQLRIKDIRFSQ